MQVKTKIIVLAPEWPPAGDFGIVERKNVVAVLLSLPTLADWVLMRSLSVRYLTRPKCRA